MNSMLPSDVLEEQNSSKGRISGRISAISVPSLSNPAMDVQLHAQSSSFAKTSITAADSVPRPRNRATYHCQWRKRQRSDIEILSKKAEEAEAWTVELRQFQENIKMMNVEKNGFLRQIELLREQIAAASQREQVLMTLISTRRASPLRPQFPAPVVSHANFAGYSPSPRLPVPVAPGAPFGFQQQPFMIPMPSNVTQSPHLHASYFAGFQPSPLVFRYLPLVGLTTLPAAAAAHEQSLVSLNKEETPSESSAQGFF